MKKLLLFILLVCMINYTTAQVFGELNIGFPTGDYVETISLEYNVKTGYLFNILPNFSLGGIIGFSWLSVKDEHKLAEGFRSPGSLTLSYAVASRYNLSEAVVLGLDLGGGGGRYLVFGDNVDSGGFYFRSLIGYNFGQKVTINASYGTTKLDIEGFDGERLNSFNSFQIGLSLGK